MLEPLSSAGRAAQRRAAPLGARLARGRRAVGARSARGRCAVRPLGRLACGQVTRSRARSAHRRVVPPLRSIAVRDVTQQLGAIAWFVPREPPLGSLSFIPRPSLVRATGDTSPRQVTRVGPGSARQIRQRQADQACPRSGLLRRQVRQRLIERLHLHVMRLQIAQTAKQRPGFRDSALLQRTASQDLEQAQLIWQVACEPLDRWDALGAGLILQQRRSLGGVQVGLLLHARAGSELQRRSRCIHPSSRRPARGPWRVVGRAASMSEGPSRPPCSGTDAHLAPSLYRRFLACCKYKPDHDSSGAEFIEQPALLLITAFKPKLKPG